MNFRQRRTRDEPEINFIPLIDLLLVILIFLMVTTTYSHFSEIKVNLPTASASKQIKNKNEILVFIAVNGDVQINKTILKNPTLPIMINEFKRVSLEKKQISVIINADAKATHQSVISVMQAAQTANLNHLILTTKNGR